MQGLVRRDATLPRWYGAVWRAVLVIGSVAATIAVTAGVSRALPDANSGAEGALRAGGIVVAATVTFLGSAFLIRRTFTSMGVSVGENFIPKNAPEQVQALGRHVARSRKAAVVGAVAVGLLLGWLGGQVGLGPDRGTTVANAGTARDGAGGTSGADGAQEVSSSEGDGAAGAGLVDAVDGRSADDDADDGADGSGDDGSDQGSSGDDDPADDVIDDVCDAVDGVEGGAGDLLGGGAGLLDGATDDACDAAGDLQDTVDEVVDEVGDTIDEVVDEVGDTVDEVVDEVGDTVDDDLLDGLLDTTTTTITVPSLPGL